jgi:hypothetical protein
VKAKVALQGTIRRFATLIPTIRGPSMKHSVFLPLSYQEDTLRRISAFPAQGT